MRLGSTTCTIVTPMRPTSSHPRGNQYGHDHDHDHYGRHAEYDHHDEYDCYDRRDQYDHHNHHDYHDESISVPAQGYMADDPAHGYVSEVPGSPSVQPRFASPSLGMRSDSDNDGELSDGISIESYHSQDEEVNAAESKQEDNDRDGNGEHPPHRSQSPLFQSLLSDVSRPHMVTRSIGTQRQSQHQYQH